MHKKLMAAAVAGALMAPAAAAYAQTSTVNIYGRITYEYGVADQGRNKPSSDYADSPGGSAIGFRGEEKLGGNLSAWFQCESSADVRAMDQTGFCTRNSAVGFKGGFGNVFFGRWDTPFKRAMNQGSVGAEETGILGMSFLAFGGSGGANATHNAYGALPANFESGIPQLDAIIGGQTGASGETQQRQRFKRREAGLTYYESPNFGGFQVLAAFSSGNGAFDNEVVDGQQNQKPRVLSIGGTYVAGPLAIGAGYERHKQFGPVTFLGFVGGVPTAIDNPTSQDDTGWGISAAYTFAGKVKVGATYLDREWEPINGFDLKKKTWTIGVDWNIVGPHSVSAQYSDAGDSKGNCTAANQAAHAATLGFDAGNANHNVRCSIGGNGGASASGDGTGGYAFSLAYQYAFSKRTQVKFGYAKVNNDTNTASYRIGNTSALSGNGQSVDGWAMHIGHRF